MWWAVLISWLAATNNCTSGETLHLSSDDSHSLYDPLTTSCPLLFCSKSLLLLLVTVSFSLFICPCHLYSPSQSHTQFLFPFLYFPFSLCSSVSSLSFQVVNHVQYFSVFRLCFQAASDDTECEMFNYYYSQ